MRPIRIVAPLLAVAALLVVAMPGADAGPSLPPPVEVRPEPQGVTLEDPAFEPLPGARADYGRLGGSVYQLEIPANWNGQLLLFMHGWAEFAPTVEVTPPWIRRYLIGQGFAWGASSFSSTSLIPGRAADETAALWDLFARRYGRPARSWISGTSMGGMATHVAAERYGNRFDGALALCGSAGMTDATQFGGDFFAAAAFAAGVDQREFDRADSVRELIRDRIRPALRRPRARRVFEDIMISLTGGPRVFDREGFRMEEETNWRRIELGVTLGLSPNRDTVYRLGPPSRVTSREFNRAAVRLPTNRAALQEFVAGGETTGELAMPMISLHTTGDGQVPIEQARVLQRRVDAAGGHGRLVQRVIRDAGHCGFTSTEWEANLEALIRWVERGVRPSGHDVLVRRLDDLRRRFEVTPRAGTPEADRVAGASQRVVVRGTATLDGAPFDARFLGATVLRRDGLVTSCQLTLPGVRDGRFAITVVGDKEASGCGARGARIALWTVGRDGRIIYSRAAWRWAADGLVVKPSFLTREPDGIVPPHSGFSGEIFTPDGRHLPGGTRIEAFVGATRCGVSSVRRTGSFSGFSLSVVGPDSIAGCTRGATITFRVNGRPALDTAVNETGRSGSLDLTVP